MSWRLGGGGWCHHWKTLSDPSSSCSDRLDIIRPDVQSHVKKKPLRQDKEILQRSNNTDPIMTLAQSERLSMCQREQSRCYMMIAGCPGRALSWYVSFIVASRGNSLVFSEKKKCIASNRWDVRKLCLGTIFLSWILVFSSKYKILSCDSGRNAHKLQPSAVVTEKMLSLAFNQWPLQCPVVFC